MATVSVSLGHLKSVFHRTPSTTVHGFYIKKSQGKIATMPLTQYIRALDSPQFKRKTAVFSNVSQNYFFPIFSSVHSTQSCPTLYNPMNRSTTGLHVHHQLLEFTQTHVHQVGDGSNHVILCRSLLLLPSIFPSMRIFSNESALHIRWSKYWSFSFSISPSNEHPGLISFRMDWLDLLAVQGTLQESSPTPQFKSIHSMELIFLYSPTLTSIHDYWKSHSFDYMDLCWQSDISAL